MKKLTLKEIIAMEDGTPLEEVICKLNIAFEPRKIGGKYPKVIQQGFLSDASLDEGDKIMISIKDEAQFFDIAESKGKMIRMACGIQSSGEHAGRKIGLSKKVEKGTDGNTYHKIQVTPSGSVDYFKGDVGTQSSTSQSSSGGGGSFSPAGKIQLTAIQYIGLFQKIQELAEEAGLSPEQATACAQAFPTYWFGNVVDTACVREFLGDDFKQEAPASAESATSVDSSWKSVEHPKTKEKLGDLEMEGLTNLCMWAVRQEPDEVDDSLEEVYEALILAIKETFNGKYYNVVVSYVALILEEEEREGNPGEILDKILDTKGLSPDDADDDDLRSIVSKKKKFTKLVEKFSTKGNVESEEEDEDEDDIPY